jgi:hypothetical protein
MKLHQLSVFLENKPGQLLNPCKVLAGAGINIVTLSLADTQQFGILRLLVAEWQEGKAALEKAGCVVNVTEVVALPVPFHPGGLAGVLEAIEHAGISVEYMYAVPGILGDEGVLIFRFEDTDTALNVLRSSGVKPLQAQTLWKRLSTASARV